MAPLVQRLASDPRFESRLCVTAQHRQMLDAALSAFELRPDHDLDIEANAASQTMAQFLAAQFAAYTTINVQTHIGPDLYSDHWSFWQYGYEALGLSENTVFEIWGGSNDSYHQLTDVISNPHFEWDFALETVRGAMAGMIGMAEVVPEPGTAGLFGAILLMAGALRRRR